MISFNAGQSTKSPLRVEGALNSSLYNVTSLSHPLVETVLTTSLLCNRYIRWMPLTGTMSSRYDIHVTCDLFGRPYGRLGRVSSEAISVRLCVPRWPEALMNGGLPVARVFGIVLPPNHIVDVSSVAMVGISMKTDSLKSSSGRSPEKIVISSRTSVASASGEGISSRLCTHALILGLSILFIAAQHSCSSSSSQ